MKKYLLCFLAAILFLLPVSSLACEHYPGQVADEELEEANKVPPQEGVDGSEDLICPICGEVVDHVILPALPAPAEHPASSDEENPPAAQPEPEPETIQPEQPEQPLQPEEPAQPKEPAQPARPEAPAAKTGGDGAVTGADGGSSSGTSGGTPPKAQDTTANVRPQTDGSAGTQAQASSGTAGGGGTARKTGRTNTAGTAGNGAKDSREALSFPFRRIRMKPQPGIRAEAAGELLWPVYGTPLQNIYNE